MMVVLPEPVLVMAPPGAIMRVSGAPERVPNAQTNPLGMVIAMVTVQVSPGVRNEVGDDVPLVQFVKVVAGPAIFVVQFVARPLTEIQHNRIAITVRRRELRRI